MRILIAGGPRTGKSTLAQKLSKENGDIVVRCTDDVIHAFEWSKASLEVASWFDAPGPWIIEGTIVVRALRKWLFQSTMRERGFDVVYYGSIACVQTNANQLRLIDGCNTIWSYVLPQLVARGIQTKSIERLPTWRWKTT